MCGEGYSGCHRDSVDYSGNLEKQSCLPMLDMMGVAQTDDPHDLYKNWK
jgi:hypothetical protein